MKKVLYSLILVLLIISVISCSSTAKGSAEGPKGKIVIYTSMYEDVLEELNWTLKRQFPDCHIELAYGGTGQIQSKVTTETAAKKLGCDMLMVADPSYSLELKEKGMLHPYISKSAGTLAFDYDEDGYWYPVRVDNMILAFNPEKFSRQSLPNSFYDFAYDSNLRGAISMSNPLTSGTTMAAVTALLDKYGLGYFDALSRQNVAIESGAVALAKLEAGEYKLVMILEELILQKRQQEMSKLEVIYPSDGTIMIPSTIMTVAAKWSANNNTAAAETITDWFLSPEGQNSIVDGWMHSVRKNFRKIPFDSQPTNHIQSNSMPLNWENSLRQRDSIQTMIENFLANR